LKGNTPLQIRFDLRGMGNHLKEIFRIEADVIKLTGHYSLITKRGCRHIGSRVSVCANEYSTNAWVN